MSSPYLQWKLYGGMLVSTAQCCLFFQNQPVVECSYTSDKMQDQTSGSRPPWLLFHSLLPFLPSSLGFVAFPSCLIYLCVSVSVLLCVCLCFGLLWVSWSEIVILFLSLITFVLFTFPSLRHWYHQIRGLPLTLDPIMYSLHGFQVFHPPLRGNLYLHNHFKGPFTLKR